MAKRPGGTKITIRTGKSGTSYSTKNKIGNTTITKTSKGLNTRTTVTTRSGNITRSRTT